MRELRRWGVGFLADGIDIVADGEFELVVDYIPTTPRFADGRLRQKPGPAPEPEVTARTSSFFLDRWAAGDTDWDDGRGTSEVTAGGPDSAWPRWLAATSHPLIVHAEPERSPTVHDPVN